MKLLLTTIAAVLVVGCGEAQPTTKAPDILIYDAAKDGNIKAVKQHLAGGADVNAKSDSGWTPLHDAAFGSHKEITELLITAGADVNAKDEGGRTPLDMAFMSDFIDSMSHQDPQNFISSEKALEDWDAFKEETEIADLLRKHGGKTAEELKAEGK